MNDSAYIAEEKEGEKVMLQQADSILLNHNNPPSDAEILREKMAEESADLTRRRDELLSAADRIPRTIEDDEVAGKVADFIKLVMAATKTAEARRVSAKEPFLAGGRVVDAVYSLIKDPLDRCKKTVEQRLTVYQRKKAEDERRVREAAARAAQEEADRQRREAESALAKLDEVAATETADKADAALDDAVTQAELAKQASADAERARRDAEAKAADLSRTRGTFGSVASLRTFWDFEILDIHSIPLEVLRAHLPIAAVEQAVRSFVKANQDKILLPGVRIFQSHNSVVR